jgi:DNA transformation protein and related proteins
MTRIRDMQGLGSKSEELLAHVGITSPEQLQITGAVQAFLKVKRAGLPCSLNLLWAIEGALTGEHWQDVARLHRTSLLLALADAENAR